MCDTNTHAQMRNNCCDNFEHAGTPTITLDNIESTMPRARSGLGGGGAFFPVQVVQCKIPYLPVMPTNTEDQLFLYFTLRNWRG